jgi:hypothetical protein
VRSPIAVRPVAIAAPVEFTATGGTGAALSVKVGYTGTLNAAPVGLVGATVGSTLLNVGGPAFSSGAPAASSRTSMISAVVPAGTSFARWATFDSDYAPGSDIDLFLYRVVGATRTLVGSSGGGTADEVITLNAPVAGTYELYANLFALSGGATTATVNTNHWVVPNSAAGNFTVTPASQAVTINTTATVNLGWTGLTAGLRYLGRVTFTDGTTTIGRTTVMVTG